VKITSHEGRDTITLEPAAVGEHTIYLSVDELGNVATYAIRPDEAFALAHVLQAWAKDRTEKGGMF